MRKLSEILSECLALLVLAKILLQRKGALSGTPVLSPSLEWPLIVLVMLGLFFRPFNTYVRLGLSAIAVFMFLYYELYPLSPESFVLLGLATVGYLFLAMKFRKTESARP